MKIAVLFDNIGPYHRARLVAAQTVAEVLAVEFGRVSKVYDWSEVVLQSLQHIVINPEGSGQELKGGAFRERLESALNQYDPDVVAVPGWSNRGAFAAVAWCVRNQVPVVVMCESNYWDERKNWLAEKLKERYLGLVSAALVGGRSHVDYLERLGVDSGVVFKGYDVVDNAYFSDGAERAKADDAACRSEYGLPFRYFLASARFIHKKNLGVLLKAYALYRKSFSGDEVADLVLLGDGELRRDLVQIVRDMSLIDHVHMPGFKQYDELPVFYGLAEAFVHPSTVEPWGLVVNEAMACGVPVIVSERCGCAVELVRSGVNGFSFDPTDVDVLAKLMGRVTESGFPRSDFGRESHRAISEWGPERFASGMLAAAERAVEVGPKSATVADKAILEMLFRR